MAPHDPGEIKWRLDILPEETRNALDYFSQREWLAEGGWYLAGGTALALRAGHRRSVDLDFFTTKRTFNTGTFIARLTEDGDWSTSSEEDGAVYGEYRGAKVSFIANPLFIPGSSAPAYGYITVLPPADIAVMKILAISRRGRKRDFFDLYWCVQNIEPLQNIVGRVPVQYPTASENMHHLLKGLVYFEDAEEDPKPEIYFKASWKDIKSFFIREVPHIAKRIVQ